MLPFGKDAREGEAPAEPLWQIRLGRRLGLPALLVMLTCLSVRGAGLSDSIDVADSTSLTEHQFETAGNVSTETTGDFVGGHDMRRLAHIVRGERSSVSYSLHVEPN